MKFKFRPANERGIAEHGWLHARFTFSFAEYYDPDHCGFHDLMVMNNDIIEPGGGFPMHPHKDAEIFTYVISGKLEHKDSMGNGSVIEPGDLQYMSAGNGVRHSEFNPSDEEPTELYQIWMKPNQSGGQPKYAEKKLGQDNLKNESKLLFSEDGKEDSIRIRQNAEIYMTQLDEGKTLVLKQNSSLPHLWIQNISGEFCFGEHNLNKADGLGITNIDQNFEIKGNKRSKFFIFKFQ
jgi:redox-sensitive bicupin YhaK (pirin superfamily)